jgi:transposase
MTAHKISALVSRMDVVDTGRRRRWTLAEKLRIVEESLAGPRLVAATARRHGISRSLLTRWRRDYRDGRIQEECASFSPVVVAAGAPAAMPNPAPAPPDAGRIEIFLANGRRIVVGAGVDALALARVVKVLEGS